MSGNNEWEIQFEAEMERAQSARQTGNEGMARVCARRAAGIVVGRYFEQRGLPVPGPSAVDRLNYLAALTDTTPENREIIHHMLIKVTEKHTLPIEADLISDAQQLRLNLLPE